MRKPNSLATALQGAGAKVPTFAERVESMGDAAPAEPVPARRKPPQPSREGTVPITCHYPEPVRRQLKILAAEEGRNIDDLVAEGLNLIFARYGKAEIAPRKSPK